ncbi:MAG TPA: cupin domain-containing protein [Candidatus Limnocylindrales bacterium]|nr:cupin domain-containing protein [Candidatus Limnocylindrales bacterium]
MHVTPTELRVVRRGELLLRYALLDDVAYVLAEVPSSGSRGTTLEAPCEDAHWAIVLRGELELIQGDNVRRLPAGTAFHVPAGRPEHRFRSKGRTVFAGFVPVDPDAVAGGAPGHLPVWGDGSSEVVPGKEPELRVEPTIVSGGKVVTLQSGEVDAEAADMGGWILCRASFGSTSGYGSSWCDLPHWGMVLRGGLGIEWEDDVEVLSAGDVYHCRQGPPGHRFEVADSATIIDITPREAYSATARIVDWRPRLSVFEPTPGAR